MRWKVFAVGVLLVLFGAACSNDEGDSPTVIRTGAPSASVDSSGGGAGTLPSPTGSGSSKKGATPSPLTGGGAIYDETPSVDPSSR